MSILGKKILAVIPARGGSKGIPRKNLKKICGKSTIQLLIERVKKVSDIDIVILATTKQKCDDKLVEIAKITFVWLIFSYKILL